MLYISRYIGFNNYGVVDTEDGLEDVVSADDIKNAVFRAGLTIEGVEVAFGIRTGMRDRLVDILAYQNPATVTRLQAKTTVALNTEVVVYDGKIVSIRWRKDSIKKPVTIRLSDFGVDCGERILYGNYESRKHKITLIIDDKVRLNENTLLCRGLFGEHRVIGELGLGMKIDLREVTDKDFAQMIYLSLFSDPLDLGLFDSMGNDIIDEPKRKAEMIALRNW